ncbi:MAG: hypothetical protein F6K10_02645 [Moorea sp. SIO2B7]|nr:hypothetical protein [Moorena sp. SIO2B7]
MNDTVPKIKSIQAEVQKFADDANPLLTKAESEITDNISLNSIKSLLIRVKSMASSVKTTVTDTDSLVESAFSHITELSKQLNSVESTLNSQIISLKIQLQSLQKEVSSIKSKEKYYALLGPLVVAGLAAAIPLLVRDNKKVNSNESKMHSLQSQASQLSMIEAAVKSMHNDFLGLSDKLSSLKNAVDFLSSDNTEVMNDLDKAGDNRTIAKPYILTSLEVQTLAIDAS